MIGDIGVTYFFQSQYETAMGQYEKALSLYRTLRNQEGIANTLGNIGLIRWSQGRFEDALTRYRASLRLKRDIGNQLGVARSLGNIGIIRDDQGRYRKALARFQEALQIYRDLDEQKGIARTLNNIGSTRLSQGQYEEALAGYRESLQIERELGSQRGIATSLNNVGIIHRRQGRYEKALTQYQTSLQIYRDLDDRKGIANSLAHIGTLREEQGRYEDALRQYRKALRIKREIGDRKGVGTVLNNIGDLHRKQRRYETALARYRDALRINREIGNRASVADNLDNIGSVHLEAGELRAATDTFQTAVRLAETLRLNATSPEARRSLLSTQVETYRALTTAHVRAGRPDSALRAAEQARARLLADRLAGTAHPDTSFSVPSPSRLRRTIGPKEATVLYANAGSRWPLTAILVTRDTTVARELPDFLVRANVEQAYAPQLRRLRQTEGPLTAARLKTSSSANEGPSLAATIRLYRSYLTRESAGDSLQHDLSRRLHGLLVAPLKDRLQAVETITVAPTGALGYLPFETLRDSTGQYLVQQVHVRYAQSLTVLRQLQNRTYPSSRRPLLAIGGAAYGGGSPNADGPLLAGTRGSYPIGSEAQAAALYRSAEQRLEHGRSPRPTYRQLGYDQWPPLYGTKLEVRKLKRAVGEGTTLLTGPDASEERIRAMSASGELARYRHLHFATHGIAVPEAPQLSALVLSQTRASDSLAERDGYLTMREIANLKMQADVAVLSACRTGIGRIVAGEGVVSLSHAFLRAGANATLVSQWRVLDWSTQQFMTAAHRTALTTDKTFAEAVTEVKRDFIAGAFGARNTDPLRWAPFVFYGRE